MWRKLALTKIDVSIMNRIILGNIGYYAVPTNQKVKIFLNLKTRFL